MKLSTWYWTLFFFFLFFQDCSNALRYLPAVEQRTLRDSAFHSSGPSAIRLPPGGNNFGRRLKQWGQKFNIWFPSVSPLVFLRHVTIGQQLDWLCLSGATQRSQIVDEQIVHYPVNIRAQMDCSLCRSEANSLQTLRGVGLSATVSTALQLQLDWPHLHNS